MEKLCAAYYKQGGQPGIPPGVYFRMLLVGYFEGLDSQRGIAWRCADSLALRSGEARELARGVAESFWMAARVLRERVKRGHVASVKFGKATKKIWLCWTGMKGSGQEMFTHVHPKATSRSGESTASGS